MVADTSKMGSGLLPADGGEWAPVTTGESGAKVFHDINGARFAKLVAANGTDDLAAERDRIVWLGQSDLPVASVLDWRVTDDGACLITRAIDGVPADQLDANTLKRAWPMITATVQELHRIPAPGCPFDRDLATMFPIARMTVAESRVQAEFLPEDLQKVPPTAILRQLEHELPQRHLQESNEQVVCHGDLCLPNVLINPDTLHVSGLIDLGRLGRADPYADIALLLANARETWPDELTARRADHEFAEQYGIDLDIARQRFYLRLDPLTWSS